MWLRYTLWQRLTPQTVYKRVLGSRSYVFTREAEGLVDVRRKEDIEALLNPPEGLERVVEVAYERYGVHFDARGEEMSPSMHGALDDTPVITRPKAVVQRRGRRS